jgi:ribose transport system substrate-binding protein
MRRMRFLAPCLLGLAVVCGTREQVSGQAVDPTNALLQDKVLSKGPNGEEPAPASPVSLSAEEVEKIPALEAKAAIVMHYITGRDWSQAQIAGLKSQFDKMGVEVVAVTDAGFNPERQVANIQTVLALNPQIIVSIPTDGDITAAAYKEASEKGVKVVFMDNVATGFQVGEDYVSVVSPDNYGNGVASAHPMAKALNGEGEIGIIYHAADFFVTRQRYEAFWKTITENYPGITIVAEQGIREPDFFNDAYQAASAMLAANPNLKGIWAVWDLPAEGVRSAALAAHRDDLVITTNDLGLNVAVDVAGDRLIKGVEAQLPYDQGVTEAILAGYALLGAPPYVALPALPVTRENLLDAGQTVYHRHAPASTRKRMK